MHYTVIIEIAYSNLVDKAVIRAGQELLVCISGNIADGTWFFIFSINSISFFSIKNTGILFLEEILLAKDINL